VLIATLIGDPTGAIVAALAVPVAFIIMFVLLAKDPGHHRSVGEGHPGYVPGRDGRPGDDAD
jgi:hypothetical protein